MKLTRMNLEEVEVTTDLLCNLCGKTLKQYFGRKDDDWNYCGLEEVFMYCGFGSLNDGNIYTFSLCEKCTEELMRQFVLPAQVKDYLNGE